MLIAEVVPLQDLLRLGFSALLVAMAKDSSAFSRPYGPTERGDGQPDPEEALWKTRW